MMALNNLLASPSFESWREGEPLDIDAHAARARRAAAALDRLHRAPLRRGAALRDRARSSTRSRPGCAGRAGTTELRALVYMDEIFGYFPPHPGEPADQAPAPHAAQAGARAGRGRRARHPEPGGPRLQGPRQHGHLDGGHAPDRAGPRAAPRRPAGRRARRRGRGQAARRARRSACSCSTTSTARRPCLLHSRWAMSYLRGPLTREEISRLMKASRRRGRAAAPQGGAGAGAARPCCRRPSRHLYLAKYGGERGRRRTCS